MTKVFIDGSSGTAGLRIRSRLEGRADLDVTVLEGEARKDTEHRRIWPCSACRMRPPARASP